MKKKVFELIKPMEPVKMEFDNETYYVLHDDYLLPPENPTQEEIKTSETYLNLLNSTKEGQDEITISVKPEELFNFFIHLLRELEEMKKK